MTSIRSMRVESRTIKVVHTPNTTYSIVLFIYYIDTYSIIPFTFIFTHAIATMNQNNKRSLSGSVCAWARAKCGVLNHRGLEIMPLMTRLLLLRYGGLCRLRSFRPQVFSAFIRLHLVFFLLSSIKRHSIYGANSCRGAPLSLVKKRKNKISLYYILL